MEITSSDSVFINCPFDQEYEEFFNAIVFTIYRCGFYPRCAKEEDDALETRINKIMNIIDDCRYAVHDISRTEIDENGLPRFNMPFELGLFFAAKKFGNEDQKKKKAIVLERTRYSYQMYISDLNGIDTQAHEGDLNTLITLIRNWLRQTSRRKTIPGYNLVIQDFDEFKVELPTLLEDSGLDLENLAFNDLCLHIEEWLKLRLEQ